MAYTVISVFPATVDTEEIKKDLRDQGFDDANIIVSKSKFEDESSDDNYEDDVKTKSFWDYVFAQDVELLDAYSKHSVGKNNIVVYADNLEEAHKAKEILNAKGAVEVHNKEPEDHAPKGMSEDVYKGIIAKAKHDIYFLDPERVYRPNTRGMDDTMDDLGSKD
jgi:nitroreductase